jgi:fructose-1,6-bisphosphatase/inositol monophosphatase family enzyme
VDLALEAGNRMVAYSDAKGTDRESLYRLDISEKGRPEDFFTQVDLENERSIACGLLDAFPSHKIIGEEATGTGSIPALTSEPTWIVDPIDGTTNFAAGLPLACVSIGLCRDRIPEVGVVFAPHTQELYVGARGRGAFRNGALLVPSSTSGGGPAQRLAGAVVCAEFGYVRSPDEIDRMVRAVRSVLLSGCRAVRMLGSGVLDLCYVASGRLDVVYAGVASEGWKPWDFCAACVILEEAGCAIEPIYPRGAEAAGSDNQRESSIRSFDLHSTSHICASSQELLEETRRVLLQEN